METQISALKSSFGEITEVQKQVRNYFEILQIKINKLKQFHSEFVHKNNTSDLFVFGLDSLNFQSKLIDMEFDEMRRIHLAINNRIYCEYYKLYKIIVTYITENGYEKKILELVKGASFPIYKDLEPYKEYEFHFVVEAHDSILLLLNAMHGSYEAKNHELQFHVEKKKIGLNIDNFISSFSFEVTMMREKLNLFFAYLGFFHLTHLKQLNRFRNKLQSLYSHICKDIKFDEAMNIRTENATPVASSRDLTEERFIDEEEDNEMKLFFVNNEYTARESTQPDEIFEQNKEIIEEVAIEDLPGITLDQVGEDS